MTFVQQHPITRLDQRATSSSIHHSAYKNLEQKDPYLSTCLSFRPRSTPLSQAYSKASHHQTIRFVPTPRNSSTMSGSLRGLMSCLWVWLNKSNQPRNRRYGIYLPYTIHKEKRNLADTAPTNRLALSQQSSFVECQPRHEKRPGRRNQKSCSCYYSRPKRWP